MSRELVEEFWDNGILHQLYEEDDGTMQGEDIEMSEYEYLYGEEDPDDTGEHYTDWMPRFGDCTDD